MKKQIKQLEELRQAKSEYVPAEEGADSLGSNLPNKNNMYPNLNVGNINININIKLTSFRSYEDAEPLITEKSYNHFHSITYYCQSNMSAFTPLLVARFFKYNRLSVIGADFAGSHVSKDLIDALNSQQLSLKYLIFKSSGLNDDSLQWISCLRNKGQLDYIDLSNNPDIRMGEGIVAIAPKVKCMNIKNTGLSLPFIKTLLTAFEHLGIIADKEIMESRNLDPIKEKRAENCKEKRVENYKKYIEVVQIKQKLLELLYKDPCQIVADYWGCSEQIDNNSIFLSDPLLGEYYGAEDNLSVL